MSIYKTLLTPQAVQASMRSMAMKRLEQIDMNCGMNYTSIPMFDGMPGYSRARHSYNVALLVYRFTHDLTASLAGLYHDIATPAFSHVVDFMNHDYLKQEFTEEKTEELIRRDPVLMRILMDVGIPVSQVSNYHQYPIADNDAPGLSCDRLEYTLENAVNYGIRPASFSGTVVKDLFITENEAGEEELTFHQEEIAYHFAEASLLCGAVYSGNNDRYGMELLSRILKDAIQQHILTPDDLYTTEPEVIEKLNKSALKDAWDWFTGLYEVTVSDSDGIIVDAKRRYIDPLVEGKGRLSSFHSVYRAQVEQFLSEDYSVRLKGNSYGKNDCGRKYESGQTSGI